jgi:hypothetical protein
MIKYSEWESMWEDTVAAFVTVLSWCLSRSKGKKVKLSQCFKWAPCHEGILGEWKYSSIHSLTWVLDGGGWSALRPSCFTPRERAPDTHWIGAWVGPRPILDMAVKRKIPSPCWESNPRTPIIQPIAQCYTDWAITALSKDNCFPGHDSKWTSPEYKSDILT